MKVKITDPAKGQLRRIYDYHRRKGNGISEVLQENHYYPFGMAMNVPWVQNAQANKYQYNGKERGTLNHLQKILVQCRIRFQLIQSTMDHLTHRDIILKLN